MSRRRHQVKKPRRTQESAGPGRELALKPRSTLLIASGFSVILLALLVVAAFLGLSGRRTHLAFVSQPVAEVVGQPVPDEGPRRRLPPGQPVTYPSYPPTSGPHYGPPDGPVPWGSHGPLVEGQYLHNLEHGGVAILCNCPTDCTNLRKQLQSYVDNLAPLDPAWSEVKMVVTPYARGMGQHRIALLAWHWLEYLDSYNQDAITKFYEVHVDQCCEQIE